MQARKLTNGTVATIHLSSGLDNEYEIHGSSIEENYYGKIYRGIRKSDNKEILIRKSKLVPQDFNSIGVDPISVLIDGLTAIEATKKIPHENIATYFLAGIDLESKELFEIMEYCPPRSTLSIDFTVEESLNACYQIASGLSHLHSNNFIHRDVRLENIMAFEINKKKTYKIMDFGLSLLKSDLKATSSGQVKFKAPETIQSKKTTSKSDIWSLGITLFFMLFKKYPFNGSSNKSIEDKIASGNFEYPVKETEHLKYHLKIKDLLESMLRKKQEDRYTADQVMKAISDIQNSNLKGIEKPLQMSSLKTIDRICIYGRGFAKMNTISKFFFSVDRGGNLHKIDGSSNKIVSKKTFDVGRPDELCSIALNRMETCLLLSGYDNKTIYGIDPSTLKVFKVWKQTHFRDLSQVIFLDNETFCAGYWDGMLKVFKIHEESEKFSRKISESSIISLDVRETNRELLIGDSSGKLISVGLTSLAQLNWEVKYHSDSVNCINNATKFYVTGSDDLTAVIMNVMNPPQLIQKIDIGSKVHQILFHLNDSNLFVLTQTKLILLKNSNSLFEKALEKIYNNDFNGNSLQSLMLYSNVLLVVGDFGGLLYFIKIVEQAWLKTCAKLYFLFQQNVINLDT